MALLLGYGAAAINPYLAFETIEDLILERALTRRDLAEATRHYIKACNQGSTQGDVEDGYLDPAELPGCPDL